MATIADCRTDAYAVPNERALEDGAFRPPTDPGHGIRFDGLDEYRVDDW